MGEKDNIEEYTNLILKSLRSSLSSKEKIRLEKWLEKSKENRDFYDKIQNEGRFEREMELLSSIDSPAAFQQLKDSIKPDQISKPKRSNNWFPYVAASVLLLFVTGWLVNEKFLFENGEEELLALNDFEPGKEKAKLVLPDGTEMELENKEEGIFSQERGFTVSKKEGQVIFKGDGSSDGDEFLAFHTIQVPQGGKFKVKLSDGTNVWLNSSSSIHFPPSFLEKERVVELSGEAYFEVAHHEDWPFIVMANGTEIKVLGTHFNVKAYKNEPYTQTTLLEGSVAVNYRDMSQVIHPGEQLISNDELSLKKVSTEEVVAWKEGTFMFKSTRLDDILRQLERWYGIKLSSDVEIPQKHFSGTITMDTNLSKVLEMLELSGAVNFEIRNGILYVKNN
mgnify:CR=1 FL=1